MASSYEFYDSQTFFDPKKAFHKYEQVVSGHKMNEILFFVDSYSILFEHNGTQVSLFL